MTKKTKVRPTKRVLNFAFYPLLGGNSNPSVGRDFERELVRFRAICCDLFSGRYPRNRSLRPEDPLSVYLTLAAKQVRPTTALRQSAACLLDATARGSLIASDYAWILIGQIRDQSFAIWIA